MGKLLLQTASSPVTTWSTAASNGYILCHMAANDRIETYQISNQLNTEAFIITLSLAQTLGFIVTTSHGPPYVILVISNDNTSKSVISAFSPDHSYIVGTTVNLTNIIAISSKQYYGVMLSSISGIPQDAPLSCEYFGVYQQALTDTVEELLSLITIAPINEGYPITYSSTHSTVSGPSEAAVGDTVTVSAVPDVDYGITDQSTQISVTNNDVAVPFTWDAANQRITFTMPDPS